MKFDDQRFSRILRDLIRFKAGTSKVPIRAENWDELIWATLVFMFGEEKVDWDPQAHEKSVDIKVDGVAGKITKANIEKRLKELGLK